MGDGNSPTEPSAAQASSVSLSPRLSRRVILKAFFLIPSRPVQNAMPVRSQDQIVSFTTGALGGADCGKRVAKVQAALLRLRSQTVRDVVALVLSRKSACGADSSQAWLGTTREPRVATICSVETAAHDMM